MRRLIFCVTAAVLCAFFFCGCTNIKLVLQKNIAEINYNSFTARDSVFRVEYRTGKRENDYVSDGKQGGKLVPFGVLAAYKMQTKLPDNKASFRLIINEQEYKGEFEVNPYDNSLVFDTGTICSNNAQVSVIIYYETAPGKKTEREYVLKNTFGTQDATAEQALNIALKTLRPQLRKVSRGGKMLAEVFVRIVFPSTAVNKPKWFVSVLSESGYLYAVVVDPATRQILAKKL